MPQPHITDIIRRRIDEGHLELEDQSAAADAKARSDRWR
jgi:hypothetical protein